MGGNQGEPSSAQGEPSSAQGEPSSAGQASASVGPREQDGSPPEADERVGPVAIARHRKTDGRALILYSVDR